MEREKIDRINELAKIKKERELSDEEKTEHAALRKEYIDAVKQNVTRTLENTYIKRPDGTKEKLKRKE